MKKDKFLQMARLLLTPLVMVLLGLLLLLRPDSASALVGRVMDGSWWSSAAGWCWTASWSGTLWLGGSCLPP